MKKNIYVLAILVLSLLIPASQAYAQDGGKKKVKKKVTYRKTQEVSFDGDSVDGVRRNPYGAYLVQKRGIDFVPLYKVRNKFDTNIKNSAEYLK